MTADAGDLEQLEQWIAEMLGRLEPGRRRSMALRIAKTLRTANAERIAAQVQPDGSAFEPRKPQKGNRGRVGTIKQRRHSRKMFARLRQARFLRAEASPDEAIVGFGNPGVARVARVHQLGLRDRISRAENSPTYDYPERVVLGFARSDPERVMDIILPELSEN